MNLNLSSTVGKTVIAWVLAIAMPLVHAEIVIGQSASLTGATASQGKDFRDGALAYFSKINAKGGINGEKIRLETLDDGGKVEATKANSDKLVQSKDTLLLFGYTGRNSVVAGIEIAEKSRIAFVAPFTGGGQAYEPSYGVFTIRASYEDEIRTLVKQLAPLGITKIGLVYFSDDKAMTNKKAFEQAMSAIGKKPSVMTGIDREGKTVNEVVSTIAKTDTDAVIVIAQNKILVDLTKGLRAAGSKAKTVTASFANGSDLGKELGREGMGMMQSQVVPLKKDVALVNEFHKDLKAFRSDLVASFVSQEGYIAARVVVEALRKMNKNAANRRGEFVRAMESLNELNISGYSLKFSPTDHNGSSYVELTMLRADGSFAR
jgi:ABC-type branched-subunit amino acid transport system substrate-binding protein